MSNISPPTLSVMRSDGTSTIRQIGLRRSRTRDLYHSLRRASWARVLWAISGVFIAANLLFAGLYRMGGDCIANARPSSFVDDFYFSVQTMATIGYGGMTPVGPWANMVMVLESLFGIILTATATGVIFSKFATPDPRVVFSKNVIVTKVKGVPTLSFRMANQRTGHLIVEATVRVTLARDEAEEHGGTRRRLFDLKLERSVTPLFQLSWSVFHTIDETSPLYGIDATKLHSENMSLIVTFSGIDDSLSQTVHTRRAYAHQDFVFGARFADILMNDDNGDRVVDHGRFHELVMLDDQKN
jgi:inward rectifier potassium channel